MSGRHGAPADDSLHLRLAGDRRKSKYPPVCGLADEAAPGGFDDDSSPRRAPKKAAARLLFLDTTLIDTTVPRGHFERAGCALPRTFR